MAVQEKFDLVIRAQDEASATLRSVNKELGAIGSTTLPRVATGFDGYNRAVSRATNVTSSLAGQIVGIHPKLSNFAGAFLFTTPAVAAASVAIGLLIKEISEIGNTTDETTAIVNKHIDAINRLAGANQAEADIARSLLASRRADLQSQLSIAQAQLTALQTEALSGIQTYTALSRILGPFLVKSTADGGAGVAALVAKIAELKESLGLLSGQMYGPTRDDMERFIAQEKQAAKDAEMLNKALRERARLLQGLQQGDFRGIGADASLRGPGYFGVPQDEVDQANKDAKDAMRRLWEIPEEETRMLEEAQAQWMEFSSMVLSSTDQLATGITEMFFGLRDSLADVFKSMAMNWVKYFINEIIKQTALRLGFQLFNVIFPGSGSALGQAGASDVGVLPFELARRSQSTGIDIAAAGAKRFSGGAQPSSVVIQFNAPIIGDEQFVREKIAPQIERLARFQLTRIQVA